MFKEAIRVALIIAFIFVGAVMGYIICSIGHHGHKPASHDNNNNKMYNPDHHNV